MLTCKQREAAYPNLQTFSIKAMDSSKNSFEKIFEQFTETNGEVPRRKSALEILTSTVADDSGKFLFLVCFCPGLILFFGY